MRNIVQNLGPVQLGEFIEADFARLHEIFSDERVSRYAAWPPNTEEISRGFLGMALAAQEARTGSLWEQAHLMFAVVDSSHSEERQMLGTALISAPNRGERVGEVGYSLSPGVWGQGYGTLICTALAELGFERMKLERIEATCHPGNTASVRVLEKSGFTREGLLRGHKQLADGTRRDSLLFARLASD